MTKPVRHRSSTVEERSPSRLEAGCLREQKIGGKQAAPRPHASYPSLQPIRYLIGFFGHMKTSHRVELKLFWLLRAAPQEMGPGEGGYRSGHSVAR